MMSFILCMLLNAHPDFWLSQAHFDKKYFGWQSGLIVDLHRDLAKQYAWIAEQSAKGKEAHYIRSLIHLAEQVATEVRFRERELQRDRRDKRIELLLRLPPPRNRR